MSVFSSNEHFSMNPVGVDIKRSTFDRSNTHKTTFDAGKLIPIFLDEVLPGDTFNVQYSYVIRLATPLFPTMDTANLDVYFFFVPTRIIWDDFKKFMGENDQEWTTGQQEITVPQIISTTSGDSNVWWWYDELGSYMGIPSAVRLLGRNRGVNALPFRAYAQIWNDWFRDQNTQRTCYINKTSNNIDMKNRTTGLTNVSFYNNVQYGKECAPVNKYHDYFTSCLPGPQKGEPVRIPIAGQATLTGNAPVVAGGNASRISLQLANNLYDQNGNIFEVRDQNLNNYYQLLINGDGFIKPRRESSGNVATDVMLTSTKLPSMQTNFDNSNARVNLSDVSATTINELRQAFQIQRLLEKDARGGTRYIEIIRSHFGVISPDARLQRSEYLGGGRQPITIEQVLQTSNSTSTSPLGQTGAFSLTADKNDGFVKSFTEHGYIIGVCAVRVQHSYAQGLNRMWFRNRKYDYYWPALANIGEQPVYKKEIFYTHDNNIEDNGFQAVNNEPFGYQEAWAEYRYKLNQVSGLFAPQSQQSLKSWTYVDHYTSAPSLNADWMQESKANIAQTIAVQNQPQFIADFYFKNQATRPMPVYSVPGLIDHN